MKQLKDNGIKEIIRLVKNELKGYSKTNHNHDSTYSKTNHTHDYSNTYAPKSHTHNYASTSHTHDDRYYTESEIDNKLGNKQDKISLNTYQRIAKYTNYITKELEFIHYEPISPGSDKKYNFRSNCSYHLIFLALVDLYYEDIEVDCMFLDHNNNIFRMNSILNAADSSHFRNPSAHYTYEKSSRIINYSTGNNVYGFWLSFDF